MTKATRPPRAAAAQAVEPRTVPAPPEPADPPVGVLDRALLLLDAFSKAEPRLHLRELAARTGLDKATLLRQLATLARANWVQRFDDGRWAPGPAALKLAGVYLATFNLADRLQPVLARVMQATGETVAFYIRSGNERVCLFRDNAQRGIAHHVEVGNRIALADGGSSAHVLQAYTGDDSAHAAAVRAQGHWMTRSERLPDLASVAVPVFEGDGRFIGALVVIGPGNRLNQTALRAAARSATQELAAQGFATQPDTAEAAATLRRPRAAAGGKPPSGGKTAQRAPSGGTKARTGGKAAS